VDEKSRLGGEVLRHGIRYHASVVPDDGFMATAYEAARQFLNAQGFVQYEISNFALPGFESRHNRKYWNLEPYIGLGAGAHSFDGEWRWASESNAELYTAQLARGESPITETHRLTPDEQVEEFFFVGLRQTAGVRLSDATKRWGKAAVSRFRPVIDDLQARGLLQLNDERIRMADDAFIFSNEVFQEFLLARTEAS
jgi:oxygen-independent coproporphyrinogen-3 oxidase